MSDLVLVTGAGGFLGTHLTRALLRAGFRVRASVRDLAKARDRLFALAPPEQHARLSIVALDLAKDDGWRQAADGCTYVVHTASPVPWAPTARAADVIEPARQGTLRALRAAAAARVKRVVVTSSTAAVFAGHARNGSQVHDESHWALLDPRVGAYEQSKTLAERAAWDYVRDVPEADRFELVTVLPGAMLGPLLDGHMSVSGQIVRALLARELPGIPDLGFALVDVRDAAEMHVAAMRVPAAAGRRFIVAGEHTPMREIASILQRRFGPMGFRVPRRRLPSFLIKTMGLWNSTAALTAKELGKRQDVSAQSARELLGWVPRSKEETIVATAETMMAQGLVRTPAR